MIELDWSRCRTVPYAHQKVGVRELVRRDNPETGRVVPNVFCLFDEVGVGKSKQVVDAAHFLYDAGEVDTVLVVTPAFALGVWEDPDPVLGEIAKHGWPSLDNHIVGYHARDRALPPYRPGLTWLVTNYEFIRYGTTAQTPGPHLERLLRHLEGRKVWLVPDESWSIKTWRAAQTRAVRALRKRARRVTLLNGSPVDGSPLDAYAQFMLLDPRILDVKNFLHFRARYCIMGGYQNKQIIDWQNLDDLKRRIAPYALRREMTDCHDIPEPRFTRVDVPLTPETWRVYSAMRDELVAWLEEHGRREASIAGHATVRLLRLAQITAGFIGGVTITDEDQETLDFGGSSDPHAAVREIGREKLEAQVAWIERYLADGGHPKLIVWCRFRAEAARAAQEFARRFPRLEVAMLVGGQTPAERDRAKRLLAPSGDPTPCLVVGNPQAGGAALNFAAARVALYSSNDFSLLRRKQSQGRIYRPPQNVSPLFVDFVAMGPRGQRTVDHHIVASLRKKDDLAAWTCEAWRRALKEE